MKALSAEKNRVHCFVMNPISQVWERIIIGYIMHSEGMIFKISSYPYIYSPAQARLLC